MTLLVAHLDAAYNLARWLMRDHAEAEDMVQDAYLRAIQQLCRFSGRRRPSLALDDRTQWVLRPLEAEGGTQCRPADP
jgi:RNA polymerase sigma-70 factor (ECF subfamily)